MVSGEISWTAVPPATDYLVKLTFPAGDLYTTSKLSTVVSDVVKDGSHAGELLKVTVAAVDCTGVIPPPPSDFTELIDFLKAVPGLTYSKEYSITLPAATTTTTTTSTTTTTTTVAPTTTTTTTVTP